MLTVPKSKVVRGFSFFGVSFVYVIFEDGTGPYWARSRVLEYLNAAAQRLPAGVTPGLGPDATRVGWIYEYAIVAENMTLAELRSLQDRIRRPDYHHDGGRARTLRRGDPRAGEPVPAQALGWARFNA